MAALAGLPGHRGAGDDRAPEVTRFVLAGPDVAGFSQDAVGGHARFRHPAVGEEPDQGPFDEPTFRGVHGLSGDGQVIVGEDADPQNGKAAAWRIGRGLIPIGLVPSGHHIGHLARSRATDASRDGSAVVGWSCSSIDREAFPAWVDMSPCAIPGDVTPGELGESISPPTWRVIGDGTIDVGDVVVTLGAVVGRLRIRCDP